MSTSITWELPQLAMDLLVWSVVGLRGRFGGPAGAGSSPAVISGGVGRVKQNRVPPV